jgi:hypothetical protein
MAKRKARSAGKAPARDSAKLPRQAPPAADQIVASNLSLHDLFQQQAMTMLEGADISDEQKQSILIAMNCPCCGAGGMSFTAKLKRGK